MAHALDRDEVTRLRGTGLTIKDIAQRLGTADHNIRSALYRVRKTNRPIMNYDPSEVVRLRKDGLGKREIAERLGISLSVVTKVLYQNKVIVRPRTDPLTQVELDEIINLRKSGLKLTEIAARTGILVGTVRGVLGRNAAKLVSLRRNVEDRRRELKDRVVELHAQDLSLQDIATQVNRSAHRVGDILLERGLRQIQTERAYIPFADARAFVRELKLTSKRHWYAYVHDHKDKLIAKGIRLTPHHYKEFVGWEDFLGLEA
jgi:DNA-binding CsgD family transcriptional regulator